MDGVVEPHAQISVPFLVTVTMKGLVAETVAWKENAVSPGQINFAVRPDQINFAVRVVDGKFFFLVFFWLLTRNEKNMMLNCPKSARRSEMN